MTTVILVARILAYLESRPHQLVLSREIAHALGESNAWISQLCVRMARFGLIKGQKGPGGGYMSSRPLSTVTVYDLYPAVSPKNVKRLPNPTPATSLLEEVSNAA